MQPVADRIEAIESLTHEQESRIAALEAALKELREQRLTKEDEKIFQNLVEEWRSGRGHSSKIADMAMHPAYQKIIGMGPKIVPLLLREMEQRPGHWTWALRSITRENPVTDETRGNLKEMANARVEWGKGRGYRW